MPRTALSGGATPGTSEPLVGLFGKLPSHGDFVTRRIGRAFTDVWHDWLAGALAAGEAAHGADWGEVYQRMPVVALSWSAGFPGLGGHGATGVLAVSADRSGRRFPLTLIVPMVAGDSPVAGPVSAVLASGVAALTAGGSDVDTVLRSLDAAVAAVATDRGESGQAQHQRGVILSYPLPVGAFPAILAAGTGDVR